MKIFISYTIRDNIVTRDFLTYLEPKIADLGDIYIDLIHNHSENKQARVESELQQADIFLLLHTDSIKNSPWARWEIVTAESLDIYRSTIYPNSVTKEFETDEIRSAISHAIDQLTTTRKKN
ncbi:hypothetical protein [Pseudomonas putida]|uniref:hypothetical protein n=1 Tax=Pseudomonas putida TaxID=303 RepID=UPI003F320244